MALEPITRKEQIIAGMDLEPVTRMEKFLKEYGGSSGGGGGASVQSDWNQTDETAADFIKNKPFVVVHLNWETFALDKTPSEIQALIDAGKTVLLDITATTFAIGEEEHGDLVVRTTMLSCEGANPDGTMPALVGYYEFDKDGNCVDTQMGIINGTTI